MKISVILSVAIAATLLAFNANANQPAGTTIEVRDIFFNTPARRKFLKTERTEFSHIDAALRSMALGRFDVEWHLKHNQRSTLSLPAAPDRERQEARLATVRRHLEDSLGAQREDYAVS